MGEGVAGGHEEPEGKDVANHLEAGPCRPFCHCRIPRGEGCNFIPQNEKKQHFLSKKSP
jgi:hypothetical protein